MTFRRISLGLLFCLAILGARPARAAQPVILSISYTNSDSVIHIGSYVSVYMTVLQPTASLALTVSGATINSITLSGADLSLYPGGTVFWVTDGLHTWTMTYGGAPLTIFATDRVLGPATADYNTLATKVFRVYTGALITGSSIPAPIMNVDIGNFQNVALRDDGLAEDQPTGLPEIPGNSTSSDGIWRGAWFVTELGFTVTDAGLFGHAVYNGQASSNETFASPQTLDVDGILPTFQSINFTTTKVGYSGVLYLSKLSVGYTTGQTSNGQARIDFVVNKADTYVDIVVRIPSSSDRYLQTYYFPANTSTLTGFRTWDGRDGSVGLGTFVGDNRYDIDLYVRDGNAVSGVTRTTQAIVTTLKVEVKNVRATPAAINTLPNFSDTLITVLSYECHLSNENNDDIKASLNVLGWNFLPGDVVNPVDPLDAPAAYVTSRKIFALFETQILRPDGSVYADLRAGDLSDNFDDDATFTLPERVSVPVANCYAGLPASDPYAIPTLGALVFTGDGSRNNDWNTAFDIGSYFVTTAGTPTAPNHMKASFSMNWFGSTPSAGTYRIEARALLTAKEMVATSDMPNTAGMSDPCTTIASWFRDLKVHWYPSARPEGPTNHWGLGVYAENLSTLFSVNTVYSPTTDSTAPLLLSSDPLSDLTGTNPISPNVYGVNKNLSANLQDLETPISVAGDKTFIRVKDPQGAFISGSSFNNGGTPQSTVSVTFLPLQPLIKGGEYTMEINACNVAGLCNQSLVKFTIQDSTSPSVSLVELVTLGNPIPQPLTLLPSSPDGPFTRVSEVWATLGIPPTSTNTIDWTSSLITLYRLSGTVKTLVGTHSLMSAGVIPTDSRIKWALDSVINDAAVYEVEIQTKSKDSTGNFFSGPPQPWISPKFFTQIDPTDVAVLYTSPLGIYEAMLSKIYVTITSQTIYGVTPSAAVIQAMVPNIASMTMPTGYAGITSSAANTHALQFFINANPILGNAVDLRFYGNVSDTVINLYFDDSDIPQGISKSALVVKGYDTASGAWTDVTTFTSLNGSTRNRFYFNPVPGALQYEIYGIFYATSTNPLSPSVTPTPFAFKNTRSFNPGHANSAYRQATIFYATALPKAVDVRIYDTAGNLIRAMGLGTGINAGDVATDPFYLTMAWFFNWNGQNDSGVIVKNGLYLVRYQVTKQDGSVETQTKTLALIR